MSVLLRARMVFAPITADEGGYLAIARAWGHGRILYRDVWVDRPQGLLLLFRFWDWISGGRTSSIRVMAMLFGVLLVVAVAIIARRLYGDIAARWAAVICAVVSAAPMMEGFVPNGELLSGAVAAAGLAVAVTGFTRTRYVRWLFVAGLLAGLALSLKQTGFDGLAAMGAWLSISFVLDREQRTRTIRSAAALGAGAAVVLAAMMVQGALTGWKRWWWAIGGYRSTTVSVFSHPNWHMLRVTGRYGAVTLGPAAVLGAAGLFARRRHPMRTEWQRRDVLVLTWLGATLLAFLIGGTYWRHYWLLFAAPVSVLAGAALAAARRKGPAFVALVIAPAIVCSMWVFASPSGSIALRAMSDRSASVDQVVSRWYNTHRHHADRLYAMCGHAAVYADTHEDPPVPYLWFPEVTRGPDASQMLVRYLTKTPPTFIAQYRSPASCDDTGRVAIIIRDHYEATATVDGITILRHDPSTVAASGHPLDRMHLTVVERARRLVAAGQVHGRG